MMAKPPAPLMKNGSRRSCARCCRSVSDTPSALAKSLAGINVMTMHFFLVEF
jgi:hypothetical protein